MFQVARVQTVTYWTEYTRDDVLDLLSYRDEGLREQYAQMDDNQLANELEREYGQHFDIDEKIGRDSEKHNDVTDDHIQVRVMP